MYVHKKLYRCISRCSSQQWTRPSVSCSCFKSMTISYNGVGHLPLIWNAGGSSWGGSGLPSSNVQATPLEGQNPWTKSQSNDFGEETNTYLLSRLVPQPSPATSGLVWRLNSSYVSSASQYSAHVMHSDFSMPIVFRQQMKGLNTVGKAACAVFEVRAGTYHRMNIVAHMI